MTDAIKTLGQIETGNDIIKLIIVSLIGIPLAILYLKAKSDEKHMRHKENMERDAESRKREENYMGVISGNTAALVKLSTLLESNNQNCTECRAEQTALNRAILDKQEEIHIDIVRVNERL